MTKPYVKTFFLPWMSAILPKGTRIIAAARRYAVATQFNVTASEANSFPIEGSAILIEDDIKGVRKELVVATSSATPLLVLLLTSVFISAIISHLTSESLIPVSVNIGSGEASLAELNSIGVRQNGW